MNFLEKELFESFIKAMESDEEIPTSLIDQIKNLVNTNKITIGSNFKKTIEDCSKERKDSNENN
jgi:hypothetical protein